MSRLDISPCRYSRAKRIDSNVIVRKRLWPQLFRLLHQGGSGTHRRARSGQPPAMTSHTTPSAENHRRIARHSHVGFASAEPAFVTRCVLNRGDRDSVHTQSCYYTCCYKRRLNSIALHRCHWTSLPLLRRCHWTRLPLLKAVFEPGRCWEQVSLLQQVSPLRVWGVPTAPLAPR